MTNSHISSDNDGDIKGEQTVSDVNVNGISDLKTVFFTKKLA